MLSRRAALSQKADQVIATQSAPVQRVAVGAVAVRTGRNGDEVLLLKRAAGEDYGGIEELPSGIVEAGETVGTALRREVYEETGIVVGGRQRYLFEFMYPSRRGMTLQLNYLVRVDAESRVAIGPEHESFRWAAISEIDDSELTESVKIGLRRTQESAGRVSGARAVAR